MTGIHQLVVAAVPGDAVTDMAFAAQQVLRQVGPSKVGAKYWHHTLEGGAVVPLDELAAAAEPGDVLIYHASIGEPGIVEHLESWDGPVVLQYHNMTPPGFLTGIDDALEQRLTEGRQQLVELVERVDAAIAVSHFNAHDLTDLGYADVRVVSPIVDVKGLLGAEPTETTLNHFRVNDGPMLLFVGQLLPHKRPDALIRAYDLLATFHRPDAHLVIAGAPTLPAYDAYLRLLISQLNLPKCWMTGRVSREDLVAFYRSATAVVTASEHEGVCLPLIEAMAFGVPIIARDHAAIAETLGGAGILLPPEDDPALLCEAMLHVIDDIEDRKRLVAAGGARLAELGPDVAGDSLLRVLAEVV